MIAAVRRLGGRFLVMLGGEGLQSAFSLFLNILLARSLPAEQYGLFAIIVLIGGFGIVYMRALIGVPACIYIPQSRRRAVARLYAVMFGSSALAASIGGAVIVTIVLTPWYAAGAVAAGLFVGSWSLRSYVRMALFAQNRTGLATVCDVVFTVSAAASCWPLFHREGADGLLPSLFLVLALAHLAGAAIALIALRQPIQLSFRRTLRRRMLRLLPSMTWSIMSVTMSNIQGQGAILLLALVAGPAAYAPMAATIPFFAPLRLAATALANLTQPDLSAKLARPHSREVIDTLLASTGIIVVICAVYGLGMLLVFPRLASHAFGHRFDDAPLDFIAFNIGCIVSVAVISSVPRVLLESARRFSSITGLAGIAALVSFPVVAVLLSIATPVWSLAGILLSEIVVLVGSWVLVLKVLHGRTGASNLRRARMGGRALDVASVQKSGIEL